MPLRVMLDRSADEKKEQRLQINVSGESEQRTNDSCDNAYLFIRSLLSNVNPGKVPRGSDTLHLGTLEESSAPLFTHDFDNVHGYLGLLDASRCNVG